MVCAEWVMRMPLPAMVENRIDRNTAARFVDRVTPVMEDSYGYADEYHPRKYESIIDVCMSL